MTDAGDGGEPSDDALLAAHLAGDSQAFGTLIRRHQAYLWAVARRASHNPEDAADALQDALFKAHRNAAGFRSDAQVTSWLHRIVVNCCLDRIRHNKLRHTVAIPRLRLGLPGRSPRRDRRGGHASVGRSCPRHPAA